MNSVDDAILFEILRHRLWTINQEAAATIGQVSGSPIANEALDLNCALLNSLGEVIVVGPYIVAHAAALDCVVNNVVENYSKNPGYGPGDMYLTNNPYAGALHQSDVALVAPIFAEGKIVLWSGSVVHQTDVGGPIPGMATPDATSIYEEAIPFSPVRIVESGKIRKDIEDEYLIRSRTPHLNALDLRGQVAANLLQASRINELIDRYGLDALENVVARLRSSVEVSLRKRLLELPDGRWRHASFVEHDGLSNEVYPVRLTMTKRGDTLELDFSGSADQAPATINCSEGALRGYTLSAILTILTYDMPAVPGAIWSAVSLKTREGSVVDPIWPAGVAAGNGSVGHAVRTCVNVCLSMMLDGSQTYQGQAISSGISSYAGQSIYGTTQGGKPYSTLIMDSMAGGGGARPGTDGADTIGMINAPAALISNVETHEHNYPILFLWRRQTIDSAGPGRFRGGIGAEHALTPYRGNSVQFTVFGHGIQYPASAGLAGGEPGECNSYGIYRGAVSFERGRLPTCPEHIKHDFEPLPAKDTGELRTGDVFYQRYSGGGGFGDPLERDPEAVLQDLIGGRISLAAARSRYGVEVDMGTTSSPIIDVSSTEARRLKIRAQRLGSGHDLNLAIQDVGHSVRRISSSLGVESAHSSQSLICLWCGSSAGHIGDNPKLILKSVVTTISEFSSTGGLQDGSDRFCLRRFFCPNCGRQLDVEVNLVNSKPLRSMEPFI